MSMTQGRSTQTDAREEGETLSVPWWTLRSGSFLFFPPLLITVPAGFSNVHVLRREKRSTMAEIVEQLQEREAAQVCFVLCLCVCILGPHSIFTSRVHDVFKGSECERN